jgi:YesN/AraC family two-component response regulator
MFLAYIGILAIPLLVGMIIYTYSLAAVREQGESVNLGMLEMVRNEVDQKVNEINKIIQRVAWDEDVQSIAKVKGDFTSSGQMELYRLHRSLASINISEELIQDVFVYFNNTQYVVSMKGNMSAAFYYDLYYNKPDFTFEQFRDYMGQIHFKDILMVPDKEGRNTMFFTMTNLSLEKGEWSATVVIAVNALAFQELLDSIRWNENMNILILSQGGNTITSQGGENLINQLSYRELSEEDYQKQELLKESCAVAVRNSRISDWKYVTVIPERIFENVAIRIRNYAILGLFACIFLGFSISLYFTRKHYNPIKNLLDLFRGYTKQPIDRGENELLWLKRQTESFFMEKMDVDRILQDNRKNLKNYYLYQLLEASYHGSLEELQGYHIDLTGSHFLVVVFQIMPKKEAEITGDESVLEMELRRFIISNIFKELVEEHYKIEMVEIGQDLAAIISITKIAEGYEEVIRSNIDKVRQMTEKKFDFHIIALVGSACISLYGIHTSYAQARELTEYVQLLEEDVIVYEDVKNRQMHCDYSMDAEQKIINAIKVADGMLAKKYIEQIFEENISSDVSVDTVRYLIFELIGTLLKAAEAAGSGRYVQELDLAHFFSQRISVEDVRHSFFDAVDSVCAEIISERKKNEQDNSLSRRVETYIETHFSDPDLNISITAQYFDITPSYLSSIYKKQTGRSLLDYITTMRMDRAEELLRENYSVLEVAGMTGYRDSNTFIRSFKKKKGVTPGQLKKNI